MSSSIRRYATLISACASMATAGSLFSFSVLSGGLQTQLGYTSANLNTISGVGNSSIYVSFLFIGPLFDYLGAQLTILCGFLTFTLGYFLMYLAYIGSIDSSTGAMSLYYFIVGIGSTWKVVGLLLLFYGLSGTIYSQVYFGLYLGTTSGYLLFLTLSVGVVNLACCFMTFKVPFDKDESQKATTLSPCTTMKRNSTLKEAFASTSSVGYSKPLSGARSNSQHSISSIPELIMQANTLKSESKSRLSLKASKLSVHKVDKGKPFPKLAKLATPLGKSALGQASVTREASEDSLDASLDTVNLDAASQQLTILSDPIIQEEAKGVDHDELDSASLKPLEILKSPTFWLYALTYITGQVSQ
ncbi:hypothetical protein BC830DRAFT_72880 [Chytriomyces sp. MP71]|nr:hypothetical protein BC830DRAFT_72880 [Chytriomyces sp. MP71]